MKKIKILEVNNIDTIGRRFNGYDIAEYYKDSKEFDIQQLVLFKNSNSKFVSTFTDPLRTNYIIKLSELEDTIMSTHNQLSLSSEFLHDNKYYKSADIVHFHMYHNTKLSIYDLLNVCSEKKVVISLHDPWFASGRCVHSYGCNKWMDGCNNCEYLDTLFPMHIDNTESLWNLKKEVFDSINATLIYPSEYVGSLVKNSSILKNKDSVFIPFGIDTKLFKPLDKIKLREKYNIKEDEIVISFRAQNEFKGTNYIVEALKKLNTKKKIKIFTFDQTNQLSQISDKYEINDLGIVKTDKVIEIYNISDMYLSPSLGETFGYMLIESLSCETPVIVFDNTAQPSVVFAPECGVLVKNLDSDDLCDKIKYLIDNPEERIRRGTLGRKLVIKNYSLNVYHKKLEKIYLKKYQEEVSVSQYPITLSNKKELKVLKRQLRIIYMNLFNEKCDSKLLKGYTHNPFVDKTVVHYDNYEIQELISSFNSLLYQKLSNVEEMQRHPFKTFINLLLHDRKKMIEVIKEKLRRN